MPIVTATPRSNSNGEVVTEFLDTVSTTPTTYTFLNTQEKLKIKNNGYGALQLTVNGSVVTVLPTESKEFYGSIDSFVISSSGGVQSFEVVGSNYKDEETLLTGSNALQGKLKSVTTAGTRVQLDNIPCREVTVIARKGNVGSIFVGGSDVTSALFGIELEAKESFTFSVSNANLIYLDASISGEGVSYVTI